MVAPNTNAPDNSALLVQLCVKVLKRTSPEGMTTKELAAELDKEVAPGFDGISSSILSSKLNAVFRRSHNDSHNPSNEQLSELPLTRSQSSEIPRRLVYRYSPPVSTTQPNSAGSSDSLPGSGTERTSKRQRENSSEDKDTSEDDIASNSDDPNEPLTPKEEISEDASWPAAKRRKDQEVPVSGPRSPPTTQYHGEPSSQRNSIVETEIPAKCPNTPPSSNSNTSRKAQAPAKSHNSTSKLNLYYDAVGYDTVAAAFSPSTPIFTPHFHTTESNPINSRSPGTNSSDSDQWSDFVSPEDLGLHELDKLVC